MSHKVRLTVATAIENASSITVIMFRTSKALDPISQMAIKTMEDA